MRALIVGEGYERSALAAARALAHGGWTVGIGCPKRGGLAASSRWASNWHQVPPVQHDLEAFLEAISAAVTEKGYEVVFGAGDAEVIGLSFGPERIQAVVPYPPHESVLRAFDKLELSLASRRAGLSTPRTCLATEEELGRIQGPIVVKSRLHWTPGRKDAPPRLEAMICSGRAEAIRRASEIRAAGGEALLQEVIHGRQTYYTVVRDQEGRIVAAVQELAEPLTWPAKAGAKVRSMTVPVDAELGEKVSILLADLAWVGLVTVDFLVPDDRQPRLKDFNGRFTESLEQIIAAGVNLPDIWGRLATGRNLPPVVQPTIGVRFQKLECDLRRAFVERRGGLVRDIFNCLRYARGAAHTILRKDDPWPAIRYSGHLLCGAVRRLGRLIRSRLR